MAAHARADLMGGQAEQRQARQGAVRGFVPQVHKAVRQAQRLGDGGHRLRVHALLLRVHQAVHKPAAHDRRRAGRGCREHGVQGNHYGGLARARTE